MAILLPTPMMNLYSQFYVISALSIKKENRGRETVLGFMCFGTVEFEACKTVGHDERDFSKGGENMCLKFRR